MHIKILKRNQIIISVIALMLITVGYINFSSSISKIKETKETNALEIDESEMAGIGDARLVNSEDTVEEVISEEDGATEETVSSSVSEANNYFASSRMQRDNMYSEILETYENQLANETISVEQKNNSSKEINNINSQKNSIMIAENLIKNLGFDDVVIFMNDNSVSVIVHAETLQEADVAQIQNIVCRELNVGAELVHISVR
jgi:stage III sporulation protein AH